MPLSEHPYSSILPRPNGKLQWFGEMGHFRVLSDERSNMKVLKDWIYSDKAQLGVDIINFQDATFVTLTWLHTFLDAMGRHALLRAWQAVLEGRDDDVPPFIGYDTDPLTPLGSEEYVTEPFVLAPKQVSKLGFARFVFNLRIVLSPRRGRTYGMYAGVILFQTESPRLRRPRIASQGPTYL
jgi:hypothetical protein